MYGKMRKKKFKKILSYILLFALLATLCAVSVCAAGGTVSVSEETKITMEDILKSEALTTLKTITITLINPIASVALGAAILNLAFSWDSKQTGYAIQAIKSIVIGFALVNCIGLILTGIGLIVGSHSYTFTPNT